MGEPGGDDWRQAEEALRRVARDIVAVDASWPFPDRSDPPLIDAIAEYCLAPRAPLATPPTMREHYLARLAWSSALPVLRAVGPVENGPPPEELVVRITAHQQSAKSAAARGERVRLGDGTELLGPEPWGPAVLIRTLDEGPEPWRATWDSAIEVVERSVQRIVTRFMVSARIAGPAHVFRPSDEPPIRDQHLAMMIAHRLVVGCRCGARNCEPKHRLNEGDLSARSLRDQLIGATTGNWRFRPGDFAGSMLAEVLLGEGRKRFDLGYVDCTVCDIVPDDDLGHDCSHGGTVLARFSRRGCVARASALVQVDAVKCRSCSSETEDHYVRRWEARSGSCPFCRQPLLLACKECHGLFSLAERWKPCSGPEGHRLRWACDRARCEVPVTEETATRCKHGRPLHLKGLKNRYVKRWVFRATELSLEATTADRRGFRAF